MRTLNIRLAVVLFAVAVVFVGGGYYMHSYQMWRNAYVYKDASDRAIERAKKAGEENNKPQEEAAYRDALRNLRLISAGSAGRHRCSGTVRDAVGRPGNRRSLVGQGVYPTRARVAPGSGSGARPPPVGQRGDDPPPVSGREGTLGRVPAETVARRSGIARSVRPMPGGTGRLLPARWRRKEGDRVCSRSG